MDADEQHGRLKGTVEAIQLPATTIDVVISNCVINLSSDKPAVFAEAFRVLKPGGRVGVSGVVAERIPAPAVVRVREHPMRVSLLGVRRGVPSRR